MILSAGGSLGARAINESVSELIKWHNGSGKYHHIHGTGKVGYDAMILSLDGVKLCDDIEIKEYIYDMDVCMAAADLVICRAGAITLSELQACGKASILIPSPNVAENHQFHNAMALAKDDGAVLIEEKDLDGGYLAQRILELKNDKSKLEMISKNAGKDAKLNALSEICRIITSL